MDAIEIAVIVRDFATSRMDRITNALERDVQRMEAKAGIVGKRFDESGKSVQGFQGDVRSLQNRLQNLEVSLAREAKAIEKNISSTARARDKNRDFETSLKSMARSINLTAREFEKSGMTDFGQDLRDMADQVEHESTRIDKSTQTLGQTFRKNRVSARGLIDDLRGFETSLRTTRRGLFDHARAMDDAAGRARNLETRFQRLANVTDRWGKAMLANNRGLSGFGQQLRQNLGNLNTTIDRTERRFIMWLTLVPTVATALYGLAGIVTSLTAGLYAMATALGAVSGALVLLPAIVAAAGGAVGAMLLSVRGELAGIFQGVTLLEQSTSKAQARADRAQARRQDANFIPVPTDAGIAAAEEDLRKHRLLGISDVQQAELRLARVRKTNAEQEKDQVKQIARLRRDTLQDVVRAEQRLNDLLKQEDTTRTELVNNLAIARANMANATMAERPTAVGAFKDAQSQLAEYDRARASELRNARQDVSDAKQRRKETLSDANEQLKRLRETNQQQILDAEQAIVDAARAAQQANKQTAAGILDTNAAWLRLSDTQKMIVRQIVEIRKRWHELTTEGRTAIDQLVLDILAKLRGGLPTLAGIVNNYDKTIAGIGHRFLAMFDDKGFTDRMKRILGQGRTTLDRLANMFIYLGKAMAIVLDVGRPFINWMTGLLEGFGKWAEGAAKAGEKTGGLAKFFGQAKDMMTIVGHILRNIFGILKNISDVAFPFGKQLFKDLENWTKGIEKLTASPEGKRDIRRYFKDSVPVFEEFVRLLRDIIKTIFEIGNASTAGGENSGLFKFMRSIREGLPGFRDWIIKTTKEFGPILGDFFHEASRLIGALSASGGPLAHLIEFLTLLLKAFNALPGPMKSFAIEMLFFGRLFGVTGALTKVWGDLLTRTFYSIFARVGPRLMKTFADGAAKNGRFFGTVVATMGKGWRKFIELMKDERGTLMIGKFGSAFSKMGSMAVAAFQAIGTALMVFGRAAMAFVISNPIVLAIAAAIVIIVLIITHWKQFKKIVLEVWRAIEAGAKIFVAGVKRAFSGFLEIFTHPLRWLQQHWKDLLLAVLSGPLMPIMMLLRVFFPKFTKAMVDGFLGWVEQVGQFFARIGRWLYDHIIQPILNFFGIHSPSTRMFNIGVDIMMGLLNGVKSIGGKLLDFFADLGKKVIEKLWGGIKKAGSLIGKGAHKLKGIGGDIAGALDPTSWAEGGIQKAVPGGVVRYAEAGHDEAFISLDPKHKKRSVLIIQEVMRRLNVTPTGFAAGGIATDEGRVRPPRTFLEWLGAMIAEAVRRQPQVASRMSPAIANQPRLEPITDPRLRRRNTPEEMRDIRANVIANAAMRAIAPDLERSRRATAPTWKKGFQSILSLYLGPSIAKFLTGQHASLGGLGLDAAMMMPYGKAGKAIKFVTDAEKAAKGAEEVARAAKAGQAAARAAKAGGRSAELFVPTDKQIAEKPYLQFAAFWADLASRKVIFGEPGSSHFELFDKAHLMGVDFDELGQKWVQGRLRFGKGKVDSVAVYGRMEYSPYPKITDAQREALRMVVRRQAIKEYAKEAVAAAKPVNLSGRAIGGIVEYTSGMGSWVNAVLRGAEKAKNLNYVMRERYDDIVRGLDEAIGKQAPLVKDMIVRRSDPLFANAKVGDVIPEKGFASATTLDEGEAARRFGGVIAEIRVPKGSRVLDMMNARGVKGTVAEGRLGKAGEGEVLLPRGGSYRVLKAGRLTEGMTGQHRSLVLEWIPPQAKGYEAGGIYKAVAGGLLKFAEAGHDEAFISLDPRHKRRSMGIIAEVLHRLGEPAAFALGGIAKRLGSLSSGQATIGSLLSSWSAMRSSALYSPSYASHVPALASGGIVTHGPTVQPAINKKLEQNFNIRMDDEQDWDYAMRIAAIHALGSW